MVRYEEFADLEEMILKELDQELPGTERFDSAIDSYTKLEKMRIEQQKADAEQEKLEAQKKRDTLDMCLKHSVNMLQFLIALGFSKAMVKMILKFEEEGSVTSFAGRQTLTKVIGRFMMFK